MLSGNAVIDIKHAVVLALLTIHSYFEDVHIVSKNHTRQTNPLNFSHPLLCSWKPRKLFLSSIFKKNIQRQCTRNDTDVLLEKKRMQGLKLAISTHAFHYEYYTTTLGWVLETNVSKFYYNTSWLFSGIFLCKRYLLQIVLFSNKRGTNKQNYFSYWNALTFYNTLFIKFIDDGLFWQYYLSVIFF